jgi:hypothetical protein
MAGKAHITLIKQLNSIAVQALLLARKLGK